MRNPFEDKPMSQWDLIDVDAAIDWNVRRKRMRWLTLAFRCALALLILIATEMAFLFTTGRLWP